jgi:hypothetical protein
MLRKKRDLPRDQESLLLLRIHPSATGRKRERADGVQRPRDLEWKVFLDMNHLMIPPGTALIATLCIVHPVLLVLLDNAARRARKRGLVDFAEVLPSSRGL